jgi:hypothetical protein
MDIAFYILGNRVDVQAKGGTTIVEGPNTERLAGVYETEDPHTPTSNINAFCHV